MKKTNKLLSLILVLLLALSVCLAGCTPTPTPDSGSGSTTSAGGDNSNTGGDNSTGGDTTNTELVPGQDYKEGTTLRMATGYNNAKTGIRMDAEVAKEGITLADGNTYNTGDLKPTWAHLQNLLKVKYEDKYTGKSASNTWEEFKTKLDTVDMISVTAAKANAAGEAGQLVDIAQYLDKMPNFKAYLEANQIVRLSITGNTKTGAIYFSPYFDGSNDIERMPLMRVDMVEKLLNGDGAFTAEASKNLATAAYEPFMPTSGKVEVDVINKTTLKVEKLTKDYDKGGNIVKTMNDALAAGTVTGIQAVNMLRDYIDKAYDGYYGINRADLFIGQNAAWDADEMVALLRCVVANPKTLNGTDTIQGLFPREDANNQRRIDLFRFAGTLFGVRGLESRADYLYFDKDGNLMDARNQEDTYIALERMNAMKREGLISQDYNNDAATTSKSENYIKQSTGFMSYDYNQTQTVWSKDDLQYRAVLVPVSKWNDGTSASGTYMRFTESWRSVKTDAWAISKAGIGNDQDKLNACLKLIDYAYSVQGQITMSYGPDAFISVKDATVEVKTMEDISKKYNTFDFNGEQWPEISDGTFSELQEKAKGNYTNYARQFLGSTLSFLKSQAFEVQCTSAFGKEGSKIVSNAVKLGLIKHPLLTVNEGNMWWTSIPTVLPIPAEDNTIIDGYTNLLSKGKYSQSSTKDGGANVLVDIISGGYEAAADFTDRASAIAKANEWGVADVLLLKQPAVKSLLEYYNKIKK